ncbi:hypothetical protein [Amycolatopsis taiwanensis]|uniref:Polysaccharide pyruvyl transferase domain-containing protein n=1 Tax=Amycolatopsis taiwanensis TaxID=342230 RepID=A0A9W6R516_9PSEU|nr:hypothetical protein [Amycolatopsis taiwanensis]GLY69239.1 hypothetical protein Atai01_58580 [Amycolatopsis taiwanensis]
MTGTSDLGLSELGVSRARRHRRARGRRVLLVGDVGTGDIGDDVLLAEALRALGGDAEPRVLSHNPMLVEAIHRVRAVPASAQALLTSLCWCDAVVVVGEPSAGRGWPVVVSACLTVGREATYLTFCGGAAMSRPVRRSRRSAGEHDTSAVYCDEVFARLPAEPAEYAQGALAAAGVPPQRPLLLLAPKAMPDECRTLDEIRILAGAARAWDRHGGTVAGIAMSAHADFGIDRTRRDEALLGEVSAQLGHDLPVVGPLLPPRLAKAVVGQAEAVAGARLPALALAAAQGVALLGFPWEEQTAEFLSRLGLPALPERPLPGDAAVWVDALRLAAAPWSRVRVV